MQARFRVRYGLCAVGACALLALFPGCVHRDQQVKDTGPATSSSAQASSEDDDWRGSPADKRADSYAHYATGLIYEYNQQANQAFEEYALAAKADPANETMVLEAARHFLETKQAVKAEEILSLAAAEPSASGEVYALLSVTYAQLGKTDLAIQASRTAIKKTPRFLFPYQNLIHLYCQTGKKTEALRVIDEAARQPAQDAAYLADLGQLYIASQALLGPSGQSLTPRLIKAMDEAIKHKPTEPVILLKIGDGYKAAAQFKKAIDVYLQIQKLYPKIPSIREKLADCYLQSGDKKGAAEQLQRIAREDPGNVQAYFILGGLAADDKDFEKAADFYNKTILFNPDFEPAYYDLAGMQIGMRKPADALKTLSKLPESFSKKPGFLLEYYSGLAYSEMKDYSKAIQHYTSAELIAKTGDTNRLNHIFYFQFGAALERDKQLEASEKYFRKCLEVSPDFSEALNYLGYMWAEQGIKLEEARKLIEKANKVEPDNAAFLDSLAWVYYKLNQPEKALKPMLRSIEKNKEPDATLYDHLGDIYMALKQPEKARDAWKKSIEIEASEAVEGKLRALPSH